METKEMTILSVAQEILDNLVTKKRKDDKEFVCLKERIDWQIDIMHQAHGDRLPDDDVYERIEDILSAFVDADVQDEDEAREALQEIEPDIYTSDLTEWLHARNDNTYYLTQAIEEYGDMDGFQALAMAQKLYIEEIGNELISGILKYIEEEV